MKNTTQNVWVGGDSTFRLVRMDEHRRTVATCRPILRATAFGDWEYAVGKLRGRARSESEAKEKVQKLLK